MRKCPNYHFETWFTSPRSGTNPKIPKLKDTLVINTPPLIDGNEGGVARPTTEKDCLGPTSIFLRCLQRLVVTLAVT